MVANNFAKTLYFPILSRMCFYQLAVTPTLTRYYTIYVSRNIERLGKNQGKYDVKLCRPPLHKIEENTVI